MLEGHSLWVTTVVFSPDSQLVVSGSWDKTVRLWNRETKHELTISLSTAPQYLDFNLDVALLFIDSDSFNIDSGEPVAIRAAPKSRHGSKSTIFARGEWVLKSSRRVLWLPPVHRPQTQASHGSTIVFGFSDGRVSFLSWIN